MIGVKQKLILKQALERKEEYALLRDAIDVYDLPMKYKTKKKAMIILKKLVIYGFLEQDGKIFWLTEKGKEILR